MKLPPHVMLAAGMGDEAAVAAWLDGARGRVDATCDLPDAVGDGAVRGRTLLMAACSFGQEQLLEMLVLRT